MKRSTHKTQKQTSKEREINGLATADQRKQSSDRRADAHVLYETPVQNDRTIAATPGTRIPRWPRTRERFVARRPYPRLGPRRRPGAAGGGPIGRRADMTGPDRTGRPAEPPVVCGDRTATRLGMQEGWLGAASGLDVGAGRVSEGHRSWRAAVYNWQPDLRGRGRGGPWANHPGAGATVWGTRRQGYRTTPARPLQKKRLLIPTRSCREVWRLVLNYLIRDILVWWPI